jgi:hypothetical protein
MAGACVLASILASSVTAHAETDLFMRTVRFALTGSDDADPKVIGDRSKCVFGMTRNDTCNGYTYRARVRGGDNLFKCH